MVVTLLVFAALAIVGSLGRGRSNEAEGAWLLWRENQDGGEYGG